MQSSHQWTAPPTLPPITRHPIPTRTSLTPPLLRLLRRPPPPPPPIPLPPPPAGDAAVSAARRAAPAPRGAPPPSSGDGRRWRTRSRSFPSSRISAARRPAAAQPPHGLTPGSSGFTTAMAAHRQLSSSDSLDFSITTSQSLYFLPEQYPVQVANYCKRRMHEIIVEELQKSDNENGWQSRWETSFANGFSKIDDEIVVDAIAPDIVGSTALVAVLSGCQIIISNCGDSRALLCRGNEAIQLTVDHKPDNKSELARIEAGGGRVVDWQGLRVSAILAVSRSIGDRYLRPWIIPVPDTTFTRRTEDDECLILASDGLWDVVSNEEVAEVACRLLRRQRRNGVVDGESHSPAQVVADNLVKLAYNKNSSDNISVIVIDLKCRATRRQQRQFFL